MSTPSTSGPPAQSGLFAALETRRYRRLWFANTVSGLGDWMQIYGRSALALRAGNGDPRATGIVVFATYLPQILGSLYGGVLADRLDRRKLVVIANLVQAIAAAIIGIAAAQGEVSVAFLAVMSLCLGGAFTVSLPASQALLPSLVRVDQIPSAVELGVFSNSLTRVVGPVLAAGLSSAFGLEVVFLINAVSFLGVVFVWVTTAIDRHVAPTITPRITAAFELIRSRPQLWVPMAISTMLCSVGVIYQPLSNVFALEVLADGNQLRSESINGWLQAAIGLGAAIGISGLAKWGRPRPRLTLSVTGLAGSALLISASFTTTAWASALLFGLTGAALFANMTLAIALVQSQAPNEMRGRIMAIHLLGVLGFVPFTVLAASAIAKAIGVVPVFAGAGTICFGYMLLSLRFPDGTPSVLAEQPSVEEQLTAATVLAEEGS